jgi:hypothetical protein
MLSNLELEHVQISEATNLSKEQIVCGSIHIYLGALYFWETSKLS